MESNRSLQLNDGECVFFIYPVIPIGRPEERFAAISLLLQDIFKAVEALIKDYLWHNDKLTIDVKNAIGDDPVCFYGTLNFAENIEDEWFLVYVLKQLTLKFQDLIVSVIDSDGEFLLIEAAEYLPSWVSPETSEGRVFLYRGHLHILPQSYLPLPEDNETTFRVTDEVLDYIRHNPNASQMDQLAESLIQNRISCYPDGISKNCHDAVLKLPVAVVCVLQKYPNLVTAAVRAFCDRDLIDLKACRAMKYFPPENCVLSRVKFTKCTYAMLASSKYQPDKRTGWKIPLATDVAYKANILGIKLACGFEILMTNAKSMKMSINNDINDHRDWLKMLARLNELNYFRGLLPHSKQHEALLNEAQHFYRQNCTNDKKVVGAKTALLHLMESLEIDEAQLRRNESALAVTDNDDSWMDISKDVLDDMLTKRFGTVKPSEHSQRDIAKHLTSFLNHESNIDGVEYPNKAGGSQDSPIPPPRSKKGRKNVQFAEDTMMHSIDGEGSSSNQKVTIEPDGFIQAVKNILDFSIPDDNYWGESDGSGMSSYEDDGDDDDDGDINLDDAPHTRKMNEYFKTMNEELASTTLAQSFVTKDARKQPSNSNEKFEDVEDFEPVNIDMNALKNIIMSYKSQMGDAGPAENLLGPMGVNLQDIDADVD